MHCLAYDDCLIFFCADEINAILRVDNVRTVETGYKPCSQQAWDQRYTIELDRVGHFFREKKKKHHHHD